MTGENVAQNPQLRHVAVKPVLDYSEEHCVLRFLSEQKLKTPRKHCTIPVLDLLLSKLAVMPRSVQIYLWQHPLIDLPSKWGTAITYPKTHTMRENLQIMHSTLKVSTGDLRYYLHISTTNDISGISTFTRPQYSPSCKCLFVRTC